MTDATTQPDPSLRPDPLAPSPIDMPGRLPAPADLTEAQLRAFELMNDPLRQRALEVRQFMADERVGIMRSRYELGSMILEVRQNAHIYGTMSDLKLADFFGDDFGRTTYQDARRLRERYEPERFQRLINAVNPDTQFRLSYVHLVTLLNVTDDAEADRILETVMAGSLNTKAVRKLIAARAGRARAEGRKGGRPKLTSFFGVVENIAAQHGGWLQTYQRDWQDGQVLQDSFAALPPDQITDDTVKQIDEVEARVAEAAQAAEGLSRELRRIHEVAEQTVSRRRAGARAPKGRPVMRPTPPDQDDENLDDGDDGEE